MPDIGNEEILKAIAAAVELPDSAYEKAKDRYEDLGEWLGLPSSGIAKYSPHTLPQGSFRIGTAIRPLLDKEEYDLDITCRLETGLMMENIAQADLRSMMKKDIEAYRRERGIQAPLCEKHRCFRLEYQDHLSFHMDIVPSIPDSPESRALLEKAFSQRAYSVSLIQNVSSMASRITDDRSLDYKSISSSWLRSNPEGYARWFEERMLSQRLLKLFQERAQVEALPSYKRKAPLQRAIQILKRHRDWMFKDMPNSKPISIIITTLATQAYGGEDDLESTLFAVLAGMERQVSQTKPRVPNPMNPEEDFADKWDDPKYASLRLEENFKKWLLQAKADCSRILGSTSPDELRKSTTNFSVTLRESEVERLTRGRSPKPTPPIVIISKDPPKPWMEL
ncbi:MAG: hypothetical protein A2Y38_10925 [Spirochaetes bacterium GWB1_59_5]|nr:MAG: hypothetical protein A2Y38_10925 [Spirochaetes bacterium GWB1_59_5]